MFILTLSGPGHDAQPHVRPTAMEPAEHEVEPETENQNQDFLLRILFSLDIWHR